MSAATGVPLEWGPDRLDELTGLCAAALPDERLSPDDLESIAFAPDVADPHGPFGTSVVLGTPDGIGAVVASVRHASGAGQPPTGFVQLVVVHPARRRRGVARTLVRAAESWAAAHGAGAMQVGAAAPLYLFTGVDSRWTDAVCCFEALGYQRTGVELDLVCPTRGGPRVATPRGIAVERVTSDDELAELVEWSDRCWPWWTPELARAGAAGTAVVARRRPDAAAGSEGGAGVVVGAAAHSVGRLGVIGPVAVDPELHGGGIGAAMMAEVLTQLSVAGLQRAEIAWVSTVRFYVRSCGAKVHRASQVLRRDLPSGTGRDAAG